MVMVAHNCTQPQGQQHASQDQPGARKVRHVRAVVAVHFVVDVVAVVVWASLGDGLDDGCDVEE
jgi:hypothetical protein